MTVVRRFCHQTGKSYGPNERPPATGKRSDHPSPMFTSDGMDDTFCHADCKTYDSRSSYEKAVTDAGCYIVGNDSIIDNPGPAPYKPEGVGQSIKDAINQLESS